MVKRIAEYSARKTLAATVGRKQKYQDCSSPRPLLNTRRRRPEPAEAGRQEMDRKEELLGS